MTDAAFGEFREDALAKRSDADVEYSLHRADCSRERLSEAKGARFHVPIDDFQRMLTRRD